MNVNEAKLNWWKQMDAILPVLDEYIGAYFGVLTSVKALQEKYHEVADDRTDQNAIELHTLCENLWHRLPDSPSIHALPKFYVLCDLCSEAYVFTE